jgi:hypothetical protein
VLVAAPSVASRPSDLAGLPPAAVARRARAAAVRAAGVRVIAHAVSTLGGVTVRLTVTIDAARSRALEREVVTARGLRAVAQARLAPSGAWCQGNALGLEETCDLAAADAAAAHGRWVELERPSRPLARLAASTLLRGQFAHLFLPGAATSATARAGRLGRRAVVVVTERVGRASTVTLVVARFGAARLERAVMVAPGWRAVERFSRWGERVVVVPPRGAVPLARLRA